MIDEGQLTDDPSLFNGLDGRVIHGYVQPARNHSVHFASRISLGEEDRSGLYRLRVGRMLED